MRVDEFDFELPKELIADHPAEPRDSARLVGARGKASVEVTLHRDLGQGVWLAFARGAKRLKPGDRLVFAEDFSAEVTGKTPAGEIALHFAATGAAFRAALDRHGSMPLPPYIKRPRGGDPRDIRDYQTIFARKEGAVAAPTAGLHFTAPLMSALAAAGIEHLTVT